MKSLNDDLLDPEIYTRGVAGGWTESELYRLIVRQIQRSFHAGNDDDRREMLRNRPALTGTVWDAVVAAVVEHAARVHNINPPDWVNEPERFAAEPEQLLRRRKNPDSIWQPAAFLRHGVCIDSRDLDQRTGDGRPWTPRP